MAKEQRAGEGGETSVELAKRSVGVILAQTRAGAGTALFVGASVAVIYVPAVGWAAFLAWYLLLAGGMVARQRYFRRLVARDGAGKPTLRRIAVVAAAVSWLFPLSIPLFSHAVSMADLGVLTILSVGWASVAVAVLAVQPRVYAGYLAASMLTVFAGWVPRAEPRELALIGLAMGVGGPLLVRLARVVRSQLRDAVAAAQQNEVLVGQLRQALQRQEDTQRARSRFLGAASHDLRQPVQALLFLSDIFRKTSDPVRRDAMAQQIVRTGESIDGMFRHLVDFAQIDAGTMKAVVQAVQLDQLLAAAVSGYAEKCQARGLRFRLDVQGPCTVAADPVLLERMLRNFLDNAYKYSLAGEIVLQVEPQGELVQLCVTDQGVGMGADDLAQACKAFYRGRSAAVAEAEGIGLGLAISSHIADLLDAQLELSSTPGVGTRVCVRLPAARQNILAAGARVPDGGESLLRGRLVAVVENDRQARDALCEWLLDAGAQVAQAGSLAQLLDVLRHAGTPPDLVLADFRLAQGTGVEAVEAVRREYGPVPAWIISGEPDLAERGLGLPVLQKPVAPERLVEAVRSAFSGRPPPPAP